MEQENKTDKLLEVRDLQVSFLSLIHISEPTRP